MFKASNAVSYQSFSFPSSQLFKVTGWHCCQLPKLAASQAVSCSRFQAGTAVSCPSYQLPKLWAFICPSCQLPKLSEPRGWNLAISCRIRLFFIIVVVHDQLLLLLFGQIVPCDVTLHDDVRGGEMGGVSVSGCLPAAVLALLVSPFHAPILEPNLHLKKEEEMDSL